MPWVALWVESFANTLLAVFAGGLLGEAAGGWGIPAVASVISSAIAASLRLMSRWGALVRQANGLQSLDGS